MLVVTRSARGVLGTIGFCAALAFAVLLLASAPALADLTHNLTASFTGTDAPGGPFALAGADAVDQSSGDVYVLDWGSQVVDKFDASGAYGGVQITGASTPQSAFSLSFASGVAVDNSSAANAGDVYVADTGNGVVDRFDSSGHYLCQITGSSTPSASECNGASGSQTPAGAMSPAGVAVDASGDLYVADSANDVVDVFGPSGNYLRQIADSHITSPATIALDSSGNLYLTNLLSNVVKFDSGGAFVATLDSDSATSVAVDPASDHVYVAAKPSGTPELVEFDSSGDQLNTFGAADISPFVLGLAVRGATGEVYAANFASSGSFVDIFGPLVNLTFGINSFSATTTTRQAGAHPDLTTSFAFATDSNGFVAEHPKDVVVDLPAGIVGEPTAAPKCPLSTFLSGLNFGDEACPSDTQVGTATVTGTTGPGPAGSDQVPVYSLVPDAGQPAKLGFPAGIGDFGVQILPSVRPGDYGLRSSTLNIFSAVELERVSVTLWGVPADSSHDPQRGEWCGIGNGSESCENGGQSAGVAAAPFLTNPTRCGVPLTAMVHADSWETRARFNADGSPDFSDPNWLTATAAIPPVTGCNELTFEPTLSVQPTETSADTPTGLVTDLKVPQNGDPNGLATAELRKAVVTLPAGVTLSPSAADGLQACTDAQVGLGSNDSPACPLASKIGTATLKTPALPDQLEGNIYLAGPESGPITGPPYRIFLTLEGDGVLIKLQGTVAVDPGTGQVTTTFDDNPQQPFSELRLEFKSGPRAPLVTPFSCGTFATNADLTPWSAPESGPDAMPFSSFTIDSGCTMGFSPTFAAGTVSNQAGSFSPFVLSFSRTDAEQQLNGLTFTMPPGLSAKLTGVPECSDADANAGTCPEASRIGSVMVGSGAGPDPFFLKGSVYLTGPYNGGPFGEVTVVPAIAGPFNLGNVVVRGSIRIDPRTAQPTVVSDPFPQFVGSTGIPTDIKRVDVSVDRPGFTFNPTSCDELRATGTLNSTQGASAAVSSRFQAAGCASLAFKPKFSVSTSAKHSKQNGDSLHVVLTSGSGQANVARVHVLLPKALPSRLATLKLACSEAQFAANPSSCPASSFVGTATAQTPILPVPLSGPALFVSHGGAAFPDLVLVLQGDGVTITLVGNTFINKAGITSSTFAAVPDVPVTRFDLVLPAGPHSVLSANGDLCAGPLEMPTAITGQNGALLEQRTRIRVAGCKPALRILRRRVKGASATLVVSAPSAGRLVASGGGLSRAARTLRQGGAATLTLTLSKAQRRFLAAHPGRRLRVRVRLLFTPAHGSRIAAGVTLLMG